MKFSVLKKNSMGKKKIDWILYADPGYISPLDPIYNSSSINDDIEKLKWEIFNSKIPKKYKKNKK